jgi:O-antigen biosynthesis protein
MQERKETMKTDIVVLSHNHLQMTIDCITSILINTGGDVEIIHVDNGSKDMVVFDKEKIQSIELRENYGFARGMNIGIACTRPDADVVIINNDCRVTPELLKEMRQTAASTLAGIVSPRTENCCVRALCGDDCGDIDLDWMPAVCWLIPRSTIQKVGLFDPAYEIGWLEDKDYCMRVNQAGLKCQLSSKAFVHHAGSVTSNSVDFAGARERNKAYFNKKWGIK